MEELIEKLRNDMLDFIKEAHKLENKAAARRARKLSMDITRDLKEYRAKSIK